MPPIKYEVTKLALAKKKKAFHKINKSPYSVQVTCSERMIFFYNWHGNPLGSCSLQEKKKEKYYKKGRFSNYMDGIDFISRALIVRAWPGVGPGVITLVTLHFWT